MGEKKLKAATLTKKIIAGKPPKITFDDMHAVTDGPWEQAFTVANIAKSWEATGYITPSPLHLRKNIFWRFWVKAGTTRQTHPSNTPLKSQCRHGAGSRPRLAHRYPAHSRARAGPKIFNFVLGQASHANPGSTTPDHLGSF